MVDKEQIKEKVKDEIISQFNELYCGISLPRITKQKVTFFVEKALNIYERELYHNNFEIKEKEK